MKILITGLTLHNNKGGPALAVSLMQALRTKFNNAEFYMAVPGHEPNFSLEKEWISFYNIKKIFRKPIITEYIFPFSILKRSTIQKRKEFIKGFRKMDLIVDLTALSYMDFKEKNFILNLLPNLNNFLTYALAKKYRIKFIRWTQTYGPFTNKITKFLVKKDLSEQKNVFVRGNKSYISIKKLLPKKRILIFPDIAIIMKKKSYKLNLKSKKKIITLSPSSVLYKLNKDKHIKDMVQLISKLEQKYQIVLVPHNLMTHNSTLLNCDLQVCKKIKEKCNSVKVIDEDLSPEYLKDIISKAYIHIGARYHSIVAALSTNTCCICLSWHYKYQDIMSFYDLKKYVIEKFSLSKIMDLIYDLEQNHDKIVIQLKKSNKKVLQEIKKNIDFFEESYNEM